MKTKFIALAILLFLVYGCTQNIDKRGQNSSITTEDLVKHKYKIGDVVYLKPDSIKAVIEELTNTSENQLFKVNDARPTYSLYYFRQDGMKNIERSVDEALIY